MTHISFISMTLYHKKIWSHAMILGISSFAFGWGVGVNSHHPQRPMSEIDLTAIALERGIHCLQIGDNLPIHTFSQDRVNALKNVIEKHKMRLEVGARKLTDEHLQRYIELASYVKAPLLRFVTDGDQYEPDLPTLQSIIKNALQQLKENRIVLGIENHDRFRATQLVKLMEGINSPHVGICLDCANSLGAGEGLEYVATLLAPFTVNLHIKDFKAERLRHKMGFLITGARLGKGLANVPFLLEKLLPFNRCESAVLEQWVPQGDTIQATIEAEKEWAYEGIEYLKQSGWFELSQHTKNTNTYL
jgi:3-oxoisoapionate decarboxylase